MMAKARLSPLTHKGETVKNELGAATLAARQKEFVQKNSGIVFGEFFHFLDSMIVQDMLAKDLYGFNTFVGLRVAEIQQKTKLEDWSHIPSEKNYVADILTKGVSPALLGEDSEWQRGPTWLSLPK